MGDKILNIEQEFKDSIIKKYPDKRGKVIGIVSGKGGVGKTSVSSLLSYAIAAQGPATLVIDMDTGLRNLDIVMGVDNQVVRNLFDVIERGEDVKNAAIRAKPGIDEQGKPIEDENLPWICLSDQLKIKNAIAKQNFQELLEDLRDVFDIIVLDAPAGIEYGCRLVTESADEAYIVCTPEMPSLRSVDQLSNIFDSRIPVSLIVNRMIPELIANGGGMTLEDIELFTVLPVALAIPFDPGVIAYGHTGRSVWHVKTAPSRKAVAEFAERTFGDRSEQDPFFSKKNKKVLMESVEDLVAGAGTVHQLITDGDKLTGDRPQEDAAEAEVKNADGEDKKPGGVVESAETGPTEEKTDGSGKNGTAEDKPRKKGFFAWLFGK